MAISQMAKVMIVSHRSQASELLEALQDEGICQILNAEQAMVTKDMPELAATAERPKDIEGLLNRLQKCIASLKNYAQDKKGLAVVFSPKTVVDEQAYSKVVSDNRILKIIDQCEQNEAAIEKAKDEIERLQGTLEMLRPWLSLETPVEEIGQFKTTCCWAGFLPSTQFEQLLENASQLGLAIQKVGAATNKYACIIVALKEQAEQVQRTLRSAEFETVSFEPMTGTVAELIQQYGEKLDKATKQLHNRSEKAASLSQSLVKLEMLYDYYENLLNREKAKDTAPATQHTVIFEGWVKQKNYKRLEKIVSRFEAASVTKILPAEGEEIPVEIENKTIVKPFELITRLYGMPQHYNVDPTIFLAPFFGLFFGICLGDAGYGLTMIVATALLVRKMQGDKKLVRMLGICAVFAVLVGALTGGWFGDAIQQFIPVLEPLRKKLMWFDPLEKPMLILGISMGLGYFQLMTGLVVAFVHNIKQKNYAAAIFEQLTWLVMLNSIVILGLSKAGVVPVEIGKIFSRVALIPAGAIVLFSSREGSWAARLGMGAYNLFSSVFYLGDVLSYLRLMALGMVGAGLAMAINIMAKIALEIPYGIGIIAMVVVLVIGHGFNLVLAVLGAFVHTMRLQFVEFFPKFLVGGGRLFEPLCKEYKHIYIERPRNEL